MNPTLTDVWLYLNGQTLEPQAISSVLSVEPTESQINSEDRVTASGKRYKTKIGLWALRAANEGTIQSRLDALIAVVERCGVSPATLPGVEEAYLDVWMSVNPDDTDQSEVTLQLPVSLQTRATALGLAIHITVAVVRP